MAYAATLHIAADRYTPCVRVLTVRGLDLRSPGLRMQVRLSPDTPGAPMIDLGAVDNPRAEGLALLSVETVDGLVTSVVQIRINESTMKRLPYSGEPGDATTLHYDMIAVVSGDKRVLARGSFMVDAGVTGADAAPSDRSYGYGSSRSVTGIRTGAVLTFGDERVAITVDGADLVAPIARRAEDAANRAEADRASTAAERQAAEAAAEQAQVSRDVAIANRPTFITQAAGEAATAVGELFAVAPGDGTAQMRKRTASSSNYLYDFQTTTFRSARGGAPRLIPLSQRLGEQAFITEYVMGKNDIDDTDAYQAAMQNPQVREWVYPEGCSIALSNQVILLGGRSHQFAKNARVISDYDGYGVLGLGYPDLLPAQVQSPIPRGSMSFEAINVEGLSPGDDFYLYDVIQQEYDVNVVRKIVDNTVYTRRPINYGFEQPTNTRLYHLLNACRDVTINGGEFQNLYDSRTAHGLGFLAATDITLRGTVATKTGGIGIGFEVAMRFATDSVAAIATGAVGLGHRNVADFTHNSFIGRNPQHDESLTFFKNCKNGTVLSPDIEQYLSGEHPQGNAGDAGNCILLDERCDDITIRDARLRGSATYGIFINNGSNRNKIINADIQLANLGGVRIALNSNDNVIASGRIVDIMDAMDAEVAPAPGIATAAIQDDESCSGNVLGDGIRIARVAGGIAVRQRGVRGTIVHQGHADFRGAEVRVSTRDWQDGVAGTRMVIRPVETTGDSYIRLSAERAGGNDFAAVALSARASQPNPLRGDGDVVFSIPADGRLYAGWRDFTGVTRMGAAPLGVQIAAQGDSAAATTDGLRGDFNALLANLRSAKLMATP